MPLPIAVLAPLIGGISSILDNTVDWFSTKNTNDTNKEIHQNDNDYNAHMTQLAWERDDNAHQREVKDLEAAGLSPLAHTEGSQVTAPNSSASPIAMQAPQINTNALINSMLQGAQLEETKRHNEVQEGFTNHELVLKAEEIKNQTRQISIQDKQVEGQLHYYAQQINHLADQIAETEKHNREEEYLKRLSYVSEQYWKETNNQTHNGYYKEDPFYDYDKYVVAMEKFEADYQREVLDKLTSTSTSDADAESNQWNGGLKAGVFKLGDAGADLGHSTSHSNNHQENNSQKNQAIIDKFRATHKMPVYHYYKYNNVSKERQAS